MHRLSLRVRGIIAETPQNEIIVHQLTQPYAFLKDMFVEVKHLKNYIELWRGDMIAFKLLIIPMCLQPSLQTSVAPRIKEPRRAVVHLDRQLQQRPVHVMIIDELSLLDALTIVYDTTYGSVTVILSLTRPHPHIDIAGAAVIPQLRGIVAAVALTLQKYAVEAITLQAVTHHLTVC